ncbi:MAG TPA: 5-formyltetrahydrofolate cyclo-ligase [Candidatus Nitrosopolaris sp.]|nr:5-formyltetrahydrofolate cyclo-ligase [Candidatus Nitrosopolaris sp.]
MTDKRELRRTIRARRLAMTVNEVETKSRVIADKLISLVDWPRVRAMHIYASRAGWNEVDTAPVIRLVRKHWPAVRIVQPPPRPDLVLPEGKFDLIIIPCLGFAEDRHRLGLGGGWYDRFLVRQPQALKIGLAFQNGLIESGLPREPHDIRLDKIITEEVIMEAR